MARVRQRWVSGVRFLRVTREPQRRSSSLHSRIACGNGRILLRVVYLSVQETQHPRRPCRSGFRVGREPPFPTVIAPGFVPFETLLRRAAAIVHHGGIGTTLHALTAGIPQLIPPMFDDQFYNARRDE